MQSNKVFHINLVNNIILKKIIKKNVINKINKILCFMVNNNIYY